MVAMQNSKSWTAYLKTALLFFIAASLFYIALRNVSIQRIEEMIGEVHLVYLLLTPLVVISGLFLRTLRWRMILPQSCELEVYKLFRYFLIGCVVNNIVPGKFGLVTKTYLLSRNEQVSKSTILATFVVERVFDLCAVLVLFCMASFVLPISAPVALAAKIFFFVFHLMLFAIYAVYRQKKSIINIFERMAHYLPKRLKGITGIFERFLSGFMILSKKGGILRVVVISLSIWLIACLPLVLLFASLEIPLGYIHAAFILSVISLGIAIPLSPGNIGTLQFFCVYGMMALNIDKHTALLYSLLYHACLFVPTTLLGLFYFPSLKFRGVRRELKHGTRAADFANY